MDDGSFTSYARYEPPLSGYSAGKDSTFTIAGRGTVEITTTNNGAERRITFENALHTPNLRSNLISVSKLVSKGAKVSFEGTIATVLSSTGDEIFTTTKTGQLYTVYTVDAPPTAFTTQSKQKATSFDIWHRRLGHAGTDTIKRMLSQNLVEGLNVKGGLEIGGLCKDCIFGKHATRPYNDTTPHEHDPLDRVHIDIWGPAPVTSAGGARYFMVVMDRATSFCKQIGRDHATSVQGIHN